MSSRDDIVFVVDDDFRLREALHELLTSAGIDVVTFGSAAEFLGYAKPDLPACLILDLDLPDINGLELVSFLKNHPVHRTIPIMVISTESREEDRKRAAALGAEEYLVKPFQAGDLIEKLRRLLKVA